MNVRGWVHDVREVVRGLLAAGVGAIVASDRISTTALGSAANPAVKCGASGAGFYDSTAALGLAYGGAVWMGITTGAVQILSASLDVLYGTSSTGILSPAQITGNQTDYQPFPGGNQYLYTNVRLTSDAARTINSLVAGATGRIFRLWNCNTNAAFTISLLHDDGATGTAAQRFYCPANTTVVIPAGGCVIVWYDITSLRWRVAV